MLTILHFNFIILKFYLFIFDLLCEIHEHLSIWLWKKTKVFSILNNYVPNLFRKREET